MCGNVGLLIGFGIQHIELGTESNKTVVINSGEIVIFSDENVTLIPLQISDSRKGSSEVNSP